MFNFLKKEKEEEKVRLIDHYQRCAIHRFTDNNYQETIDNCNLILKLKPTDDLALEFKIRALFKLEDSNDLEEIKILLNKLREVDPNNKLILKENEYREEKQKIKEEVKQIIPQIMQKINGEEYQAYSNFRKQIELMPIYKRWRQEIMKKCDYKCQMCGSDKDLEVHHRTSFYLILKQNNILSEEQAFECNQLWHIDNGEILCKKCHDKMDSSKKRQSFIEAGN